MPSIIGNTSSSVYLIDYNEGCTLQSFTLVNRSGASVTANLAINRGGVDFKIIPRDTVINVYEMYVSDVPRQLQANDRASLAVSGSVDYFFSIIK